MMFPWIQRLWSEPADRQVQVIEQHEPSIEERLQRVLSGSRGLKTRSKSELTSLIDEIEDILSILESALNLIDNYGLDERARSLRTRLRHTRTRAERARAA